MELKINNSKFWILENKADENNIDRYVYDDVKDAINRLKELMKDVDTQKLVLSSVNISGKQWNISAVPWSLIAMGLIRGDIEDIEEERQGQEEKINYKKTEK